MANKKQKYYTVWVGRTPGVYTTWEECKEQIFQFEGAIYKSFYTLGEAQDAFRSDSKLFIGKDRTEVPLINLGGDVTLPKENSLCVDGAWNTRTNVMEYQGVLFPNKQKIFHAGPFKTGTNNIAEFLAIVHALTYCRDHPEISTVYSDSHTAITWVKNKKAKTNISDTDINSPIISILHRAEKWLINNSYQTLILKWETNIWGENPADFGRK